MSDRVVESAWVDSPHPLTDTEKRQMKRMFSDFFEVPKPWIASLKAELERDPPILGKITLGGSGTTQIPLSALASSGEIGSSNVSITNSAVWFDDTPIVRSAAGQLDIYGQTIRMGNTNDMSFGRQSANLMKVPDLYVGAGAKVVFATDGSGQLDFRTNVVRFGFSPTDIAIVRYGVDAMEIPDVVLITYNVGASLTPLYLNVNGSVYQVQVGGSGTGPGGSGRMLWIS